MGSKRDSRIVVAKFIEDIAGKIVWGGDENNK
jgi:hypothetical protein